MRFESGLKKFEPLFYFMSNKGDKLQESGLIAYLHKNNTRLREHNIRLHDRNTHLQIRNGHLHDRNAQLQRRNVHLHCRNVSLHKRIGRLQGRIVHLQLKAVAAAGKFSSGTWDGPNLVAYGFGFCQVAGCR